MKSHRGPDTLFYAQCTTLLQHWLRHPTTVSSEVQHIVMSPGVAASGIFFEPISLDKFRESMHWRKEIWYWVQNVSSCAKDVKLRSKGAYAAFALQIFFSLLRGNKQLVDKSIISFKWVIDPSDTSSSIDPFAVVKKMI